MTLCRASNVVGVTNRAEDVGRAVERGRGRGAGGES